MKPEMGFVKPHHQAPHKGRLTRTWNTVGKMSLRTHGAVGTRTQEAFIYLGTDGNRLKVGMTSDLAKRARMLGIEILHSWPVAPAGAKLIETEFFQAIGHKQGDTEWIRGVPVETILAAVDAAFATVRRWAWVDPELTEEQARQLRIQLAAVDPETAAKPLKPTTRSITSFRKAAGSFGANGGRF
jgi:hypothetical protein